MRPFIFSRILRAVAPAIALAATMAAPAYAEDVTPQAADARAAFLAYPNTPAPPAPVKVCVVDTGVDLTTDVAGAVVERYSEFGGSVGDTGGGGIDKHGTFVAGVIASQLDGRGSVGIWPQARIISDRVFPDRDSGTTVAKYLLALNRCRDRGAKVVNLSLSGLATATGPDLAQLENKVTDLRSNYGINVVAAAGNNGGDVGYPARFPAVFAVAASDTAGSFCEFSSRGPEVDISTLGCGVLLSLTSDQLGLGSGTSYAAPIVSATLAALRAYRPDLTPATAEELLIATARTAGAGRILDATRAFHVASLDHIIATPAPAGVVPVTDSTRTGAPVAATEIAAVAPIPSDPMTALGLHRPQVRRASYRRGVLNVGVSGVPEFGRAIFTVDGRRHVRPSGAIRLRLKRAPRRVTVRIEVRGVGRTATVRVNVKVGIPAEQRARR